jgi:hypothetical protein
VRRRPQWMFGWSIYLLVMHFIDVYWMIVPEVNAGLPQLEVGVLGGFTGALTTLLCLFGMIALYLGVLFKQAEGVPLMAVRDPRLPEALAFHNV